MFDVNWDPPRSFIQPSRHKALDTTGPLEISHQFRCILVIIDTFTRYVEFFLAKNVTAESATDHSIRSYDELRLTVYKCDTGWVHDTFGGVTPLHHTILKGGKWDRRENKQRIKPSHLELLIGS